MESIQCDEVCWASEPSSYRQSGNLGQPFLRSLASAHSFDSVQGVRSFRLEVEPLDAGVLHVHGAEEQKVQEVVAKGFVVTDHGIVLSSSWQGACTEELTNDGLNSQLRLTKSTERKEEDFLQVPPAVKLPKTESSFSGSANGRNVSFNEFIKVEPCGRGQHAQVV